MASSSNLAYILDTVKDIGEHLSDGDAAKRKRAYLRYKIINTHPFLDGNKRTAFEGTKNFLRLNGWLFDPDEEDSFNTLLSIARGEIGVNEAEEWIGRNLGRVGYEK